MDELEDRARRALTGVGDATAGEWIEHGPMAFHLRRRLTVQEAAGLEVRDVRGTAEGAARLAAIRAMVGAWVPDV